MKYGIEYLRNSMRKEGYELISKEYSSVKKMDYMCNKGHKSSMLPCNWFGGKRCPTCKFIKIGNLKRLDFNVVEESFSANNFLLLSTVTDYKDNETKIKYICPNGHNHSTSWTKWQQNRRCPSCSKNAKVHYNDVKRSFENANYTLISKEYHRKTKLEYIYVIMDINIVLVGGIGSNVKDVLSVVLLKDLGLTIMVGKGESLLSHTVKLGKIRNINRIFVNAMEISV